MSHFAVFTALSAGHFLYQLVTNANWLLAFERSYFQGFAVLACFLLVRSRT